MKKLAAFILAFAVLLCSAGCGAKKEPDETVAVWSENTEITVSMYAYYFNAYYKAFINTYRNSLDDMGLDTSKRLKGQTLKNDESKTWFEYMMVNCYDRVKQTVYMADAAKDSGLELTETDRANIEKTLEEYDSAAEAEGMSVDEYLGEIFTDKVTRLTVKKCLELESLAMMYYDGIVIEEPTEEECQAYFEENIRQYLYYDCYRITVPEADGDALAACKSEQEFKDCVKQIIAKNYFESNYEKYADTIDSLAESKLSSRCGYTEDSKPSEWAFEEGRKPYDVYTAPAEREGETAVCMILPSPEGGKYSEVLYRDEENVRNIDWIYFDSFAEAKRVYDDWSGGDKTEESFAELAAQYGGGHAQDVDRGDFEAAVAEKIFDGNMDIGDSALIEDGNRGAYAVYMIGRGEAAWLAEIKKEIVNSKTDKVLAELEEKYPCEYSDDIYTVEDVAVFSDSQQ